MYFFASLSPPLCASVCCNTQQHAWEGRPHKVAFGRAYLTQLFSGRAYLTQWYSGRAYLTKWLSGRAYWTMWPWDRGGETGAAASARTPAAPACAPAGPVSRFSSHFRAWCRARSNGSDMSASLRVRHTPMPSSRHPEFASHCTGGPGKHVARAGRRGFPR